MFTTGLGEFIFFQTKLLDEQKTSFLLTFDFGHTILRVIFAKLIKAFNNASKSPPTFNIQVIVFFNILQFINSFSKHLLNVGGYCDRS